MSETILPSEPTIRLAAFLGALVALALWGVAAPRRRREILRNYGFNLPWWDRLLGTYVAQPAKGHEGMEIGIKQFRTRRDLWLDRVLIQPLRGPASGGALDPRAPRRSP